MKNNGKQIRPADIGKRRKYGDVDIEAIVTTALEIIGRKGALKLTMRSLAEELGISTMATYHYVPSKEVLIDMVMDRIYSQISFVNIPGSPEEKIRGLFWQILDAEKKYPGLALIAPLDRQGAESLRVRAEFDQVFKDAGCDDDIRNAGYVLFILFLHGVARVESGRNLAISQIPEIKKAFNNSLTLIGTGLQGFARK